MRWSCPHCGTKLGLSDEKMGAGWSFVRCHRCTSHSLVRKAEVNVIKVDRAPTGENVLLSEGPAEGPAEGPERSEKAVSEISLAPAFAPYPAPTFAPPAPPAETHENRPLPTPLAEAPRQERRVSPLISASIGIAAALTVSSGIYLYLEGQELWEKAKTPPRIAAAQTSPTRAPAAAPAAAAPLVAPAKPQAAADVTDHVHQNAMAPTREVQTGLLIQPREDGVQLRSGPGTEYAVIGHGLRELKYAVADWNDRWFRIRIPNSAQTAWVRNDLVQLTTK